MMYNEDRDQIDGTSRKEVAFMQDDEIIKLYWQRDEAAIHETELKYGRYLRKIAYNILFDRLDCEESVNDTYLGAWNSIPPQKPELLPAYLVRLTRRIAIDRFRRRNRVKRQASEYALSLAELDESISAGNTTQQDVDVRLLAKAVNDYLRTLPQERRDVFIGRYYFTDSIHETASRYGISEAKTKSMLYRIRMGLKRYLEQEGFL